MAGSDAPEARYPSGIRRRLTEVIRAGEWWEYKLVPIFALLYGTAVELGAPIWSLWQTAITVMLALVPGAAYVSVINDITDRADDEAAGKPNRLAGRSPLAIGMIVTATILPGLVFAWLWRNDVPLLSLYLAAWLAFSLYSLPPFRFKARGFLGVLCDAGGAHLFPTLVAVLLVYRGTGHPPDQAWLMAVGIWSLSYGVRGILWHQLTDRELDRAAGVRTFAERHPPAVARRLGTYAAFPLELLALATMLWLMHTLLPLLFLAVYAYVAAKRLRHWQMSAVIVAPKPRFLIVLHEYYDVYLPVAMLVSAALRHPLDWVVLPIHLIVFPARLRQTLRDLWKMAQERRYPWR